MSHSPDMLLQERASEHRVGNSLQSGVGDEVANQCDRCCEITSS